MIHTSLQPESNTLVCHAPDSTGTGEAAKQPNIILILADDLGWQDTGHTGSDFYETPVLDRLASEGMVFRQAYSPAANCAPSRACLLSGQFTPRHGVFAVSSTRRGPVESMRMTPVPNRGGLSPKDFTLAKAMKAAGYVTGKFGKWHLDGPGGSTPEQQGFDEIGVSRHAWNENIPEDPKGMFSIARGAVNFLESNKNRPFFLYLPHYAVHLKHESRPETLKKFQAKEPGKIHSDAPYAACISDFDASIGIVMDKLAELGLEENTIVIFTSDNGGVVGSQESLRGSKGCYYEGGIRVPMIVRWKGVTKPGTYCDLPVSSVDFYPTFLDAAGTQLPEGRPLDGLSLLPVLQNGELPDRPAIDWHFPGYLNKPVLRGRDPEFRTRPVTVMRRGDWKLHLFHEEWLLDGGWEAINTNRAVELYNIVDDPGEHHDLSLKEPAKRDELIEEMLEWLEETRAPFPSPGKPAAYPQKP
jgi:arylsulfatase A-like enzyme